jgi:hypothetical protein
MRTKDHVVPKSKGGVRTVEACLRCNGAKREMSLEEFRLHCGGVEFWGEMRARLANLETAWILYDVNGPQQKRLVIPETGFRPKYLPTVDLAKIAQYTKIAKKGKGSKAGKNATDSPPADMPMLTGYRFGGFTVGRRIAGAWEVKCFCGTVEHRSTKAVRNPNNVFDACVGCRKPVGKLRSDIYKATGVEVSWEDCFKYIYEPYLVDIYQRDTILPSETVSSCIQP